MIVNLTCVHVYKNYVCIKACCYSATLKKGRRCTHYFVSNLQDCSPCFSDIWYIFSLPNTFYILNLVDGVHVFCCIKPQVLERKWNFLQRDREFHPVLQISYDFRKLVKWVVCHMCRTDHKRLPNATIPIPKSTRPSMVANVPIEELETTQFYAFIMRSL